MYQYEYVKKSKKNKGLQIKGYNGPIKRVQDVDTCHTICNEYGPECKGVDYYPSRTYKSCIKKIDILRKNSIYIIISSIIGYKRKEKSKINIISSIQKCILYHLFVSEYRNTDDSSQIIVKRR